MEHVYSTFLIIKYAIDITTDSISVWIISPIDTVIPIALLFTTYPNTYMMTILITTLDNPNVMMEKGMVKI